MSVKRIALLAGGLSKERDISLSGIDCIKKNIEALGYEVTLIDPSCDFVRQITATKPDVAFNSLHGTYGEDGAIQGILETMQIPYTHSNVSSSSAAFNKDITKYVALANNVETPKFVIIKPEEYPHYTSKSLIPFDRPYIIKPIAQGSTIGIFKIDKDMHFDYSKWEYGDRVMIEEYIPGIELSVLVLDGKARGVIEIEYKGEIFSYNTKYRTKDNLYIVPARVPEDIYQRAMEMAEKLHNTLDCRSISRSDFRFNAQKKILSFLEINTHPRITEGSLVYMIAEYNNITIKEIVDLLIKDARCDLKK